MALPHISQEGADWASPGHISQYPIPGLYIGFGAKGTELLLETMDEKDITGEVTEAGPEKVVWPVSELGTTASTGVIGLELLYELEQVLELALE